MAFFYFGEGWNTTAVVLALVISVLVFYKRKSIEDKFRWWGPSPAMKNPTSFNGNSGV
jgi:hypothetical protein